MRQQAINWWNKQTEFTQSLLIHLTLGEMPLYGLTDREVVQIYKSYFKIKGI